MGENRHFYFAETEVLRRVRALPISPLLAGLAGGDNCPIVANAGGQAEDADADAVGDACDVCGGTAASSTVDNDGCSVDQHCPCDLDADGNTWASHGKYFRCRSDEVFRFRILHLVTGEEADALKMSARANDCRDRPPTCN